MGSAEAALALFQQSLVGAATSTQSLEDAVWALTRSRHTDVVAPAWAEAHAANLESSTALLQEVAKLGAPNGDGALRSALASIRPATKALPPGAARTAAEKAAGGTAGGMGGCATITTCVLVAGVAATLAGVLPVESILLEAANSTAVDAPQISSIMQSLAALSAVSR